MVYRFNVIIESEAALSLFSWFSEVASMISLIYVEFKEKCIYLGQILNFVA